MAPLGAEAPRGTRQFLPDSVSALAIGLGILVGAAAFLLVSFSLWMVTGSVRDFWYDQITLYPALCTNVRCLDWQPLPRVRYTVDPRNSQVYSWADPDLLTSLAEGGLNRWSDCSIVDRRTWTCRSMKPAAVISFYDGRPIRIDHVPLGPDWMGPRPDQPLPLRFLDRIDWYLARYIKGLLPSP